MLHLNIKYLKIVFLSVVSLLVAACNTGIEGTGTIKMSRNDRRETMPTDEQCLAARLHSSPLDEWSVGKQFLIADNKAALVLELPPVISLEAESPNLVGRSLVYKGVSRRPTPGGNPTLIIEFADSLSSYRYDTGKSPEIARATVTGLDLPMLIDLDLVAQADSLLAGRTLWTRSRLWYDANGDSFDGRKFVPVTVTRVMPGNMIFPFKVEFSDTDGKSATMFMNVTASEGIGAESRTFPMLFSLSDPKLKYPSITPEFWELICNGKVAYGMTKDECRLALGSPADTDSGNNWDYLIDIWSYRNGTYLQFRDGLLINYRY